VCKSGGACLTNENPEVLDFLVALHGSTRPPDVPISRESEARVRALELIAGGGVSDGGSDILDDLDFEESPACSPWVRISLRLLRAIAK
jgi:hypothetical protein